MTEEFLTWAGLDAARWALLQDKLRQLAVTERTPARIMKALMHDNNIGYREQCVLCYWLGYCQCSDKKGDPVSMQERRLKAVMN